MKRFLMAAMSILLLAACKENEPEKVLVESIAVTPDNVVMTVGDKDTLSVGYVPENAENKSVVWSSSDEAIVTVEEGVLTAVAAGDAVITADCDGVTDECTVTVNEKDIEVESVELNKTEAELVVGETLRLEATVLPEEASGLTVTWSSSAPEIASVDDEGNVSGVAEGKATITVEVGGVKATCNVTVSPVSVPVESIVLDPQTMELVVGETGTIHVMISPADADVQTVNWTSSNDGVATVDAEGVVTAIAEGDAVITAEAGGKEAQCTVTVLPVPVESVTIDVNVFELVVGQTRTLTATVLPENAGDKTVTWSSSDDAIATVSAEGVVTAIAEGNATITAAAGGKEAKCTVYVLPVQVESVTISEESIELEIGETFTLTATVLPENAADKTVTWSSSNDAIATVSADGVVTGVAVGNATIVAAAGQRTAVCSVKVSGADSGDDPIADIKTDWTVGELFDVPQYGKGVVFQVGEDFIKVVSMVENIYRQYSLYGLELKCTDVELADGKSVTDDIENAGEIGNYPAVQWCRGKGDLWYLPTLVELEELYSQSSAVNATLSANGSGNLPIMVWSCIESDATYAWAFVAGAPLTYSRMQPSNVVAVMKLRFK